jgi:hypothetical protein
LARNGIPVRRRDRARAVQLVVDLVQVVEQVVAVVEPGRAQVSIVRVAELVDQLAGGRRFPS